MLGYAYNPKYRTHLSGAPREQRNEFHHGDCIGADEIAWILANYAGYHTLAHPCDIAEKRAFTNSDTIFSTLPPLARNRTIVDVSDLVVATPGEEEEVLRSGTWATIRYAKKQNRPLIIIFPSGKFQVFSTTKFVDELVNEVFRMKNSVV